MLSLWLEFEAAETADAEFAKAMDRVLPVFQNMKDNGGSWKRHGIARDKIEARNAHLKIFVHQHCGTMLCSKLDIAVEQGWLSQ
jgi:hypothetical protein